MSDGRFTLRTELQRCESNVLQDNVIGLARRKRLVLRVQILVVCNIKALIVVTASITCQQRARCAFGHCGLTSRHLQWIYERCTRNHKFATASIPLRHVPNLGQLRLNDGAVITHSHLPAQVALDRKLAFD